MNRIIRRYNNRKLYDTETSQYVSLQRISEMIREGETIQILDKDENDLTNQMLIQIILEEGKRGNTALPDELLHELIRWGSKMVDDGVHRIRKNMDQLIRDSVSRIFSAPKKDEVEQLQNRIQQLEQTLEKLTEQYNNLEQEEK